MIRLLPLSAHVEIEYGEYEIRASVRRDPQSGGRIVWLVEDAEAHRALDDYGRPNERDTWDSVEDVFPDEDVKRIEAALVDAARE